MPMKRPEMENFSDMPCSSSLDCDKYFEYALTKKTQQL